MTMMVVFREDNDYFFAKFDCVTFSRSVSGQHRSSSGFMGSLKIAKGYAYYLNPEHFYSIVIYTQSL